MDLLYIIVDLTAPTPRLLVCRRWVESTWLVGRQEVVAVVIRTKFHTCQERISQESLWCSSRHWIYDQHFVNEWLSFVWDVIRVKEGPSWYFLVQFFIGHAPEGECATKHGIHKHTWCPDISWWANVLFLHAYLRTHVGRGSAEDFEFHVWGRTAAETKVYQLNRSFFVNNYVLELDVPMCDISGVEIRQYLEQLRDYIFCLLFWELSFRLCFKMSM